MGACCGGRSGRSSGGSSQSAGAREHMSHPNGQRPCTKIRFLCTSIKLHQLGCAPAPPGSLLSADPPAPASWQSPPPCGGSGGGNQHGKPGAGDSRTSARHEIEWHMQHSAAQYQQGAASIAQTQAGHAHAGMHSSTSAPQRLLAVVLVALGLAPPRRLCCPLVRPFPALCQRLLAQPRRVLGADGRLVPGARHL